MAGMRLRNAIAVLALSLALPATAQTPTVKSGVEAWQRGDHAEATAIWKNLAEKGDADAAFNLGQAFRLGRGVPADSAQAKRWFERAANKGHVDAQVSLGLLLFDSGDRGAAMAWLRKAADKGEPRALLVIGTALFNGDGMKQDPLLGYAYVSRAAAQGLAPAKTTLAEMDKIMTVDERKRGVAMAIEMAKAPAPKPAAKMTETKAPAQKPAIKAVAGAKPPVAAKGAWRVQLGAFSTRGAAEGLFRKLAGSAALAGRQAYYVPVGKMTRLQAGPFESRALAASVCAKLAPQPCFAVEAR
jgi:cell division septation protein DedD